MILIMCTYEEKITNEKARWSFSNSAGTMHIIQRRCPEDNTKWDRPSFSYVAGEKGRLIEEYSLLYALRALIEKAEIMFKLIEGSMTFTQDDWGRPLPPYSPPSDPLHYIDGNEF